MNMAQLKTGKSVPEPLVYTTMIALRQLMGEDPIMLYELVELCKNPNHKVWGNTDSLKASALLQQDGTVHEDVKEIVISAATGEGMELSLGSPIAE